MLSPEALAVLSARYLKPGETPEGMFARVANHVAQAEALYGGEGSKWSELFYQVMAAGLFLPNSPTLMNAGTACAQLAACFVLPIEDSLAGIFETLKNAALIHQSGGGTGFSFSRIRPRGDAVANSNGTASGPVSFITIYDTATQVVKQGSVRSGANMAVLRVDHPDIFAFITAKQQQQVLNNFNLSVAVTDDFMAAVKADRPFTLINPRTGLAVRTVRAREIYQAIVDMAWQNGEPGLFFIDAVNRANPTPHLGDIEAPNPCSEQPLLPYESCVLGSINLTKMVAKGPAGAGINYQLLRETVRTAVRFLDDVIDINHYPLALVAEATRKTRKIGLGIMGLAELFILLGIPYASQAATSLTAKIMQFITAEARAMSGELAVKKGAFPAYNGSIYERCNQPMRNATVTTIAPTGSISIIADCSSGIEPLFALAFKRRVLEGQVLTSINKVVLNYLKQQNLLSAQVQDMLMHEGTVKNTSLPDNIKAVLATAHEVAPYWHVAHLAAAQRYTDNGVSKTVNLPQQATPDTVSTVFMQAFDSGCKGVTVYRDKSRSLQVLTHGTGAACNTCSL